LDLFDAGSDAVGLAVVANSSQTQVAMNGYEPPFLQPWGHTFEGGLAKGQWLLLFFCV